MTILIVKYKAQ